MIRIEVSLIVLTWCVIAQSSVSTLEPERHLLPLFGDSGVETGGEGSLFGEQVDVGQITEGDWEPVVLESSSQPTSSPRPSSQPTSSESMVPSYKPSLRASSQPTSSESMVPSNKPSPRPSSQPTSSESMVPSNKPSLRPSNTNKPSKRPSNKPSRRPSPQPTLSPRPSSQPTGSDAPTSSNRPTDAPTTFLPTGTFSPTSASKTTKSYQPHDNYRASSQPTGSDAPSSPPSVFFQAPTQEPTSNPSLRPSSMPSMFAPTPPQDSEESFDMFWWGDDRTYKCFDISEKKTKWERKSKCRGTRFIAICAKFIKDENGEETTETVSERCPATCGSVFTPSPDCTSIQVR